MNTADQHLLSHALARLSRGDRSAFDQVYYLCKPEVFALSRRLLGPGPDAEDAAQVALLKVFENASVYDPQRPALPWILGVAGWECRTIRKRRGRSREVQRGSLPERAVEHAGAEHEVIRADLRRAVEHVMGTLRPADRETLEVLLEQRGRPNIQPATFRKRLQRAIERLRAAWEAEHDLP